MALDLIDTGVGMDERTAMKMFDPFYTTKSGGSGLGLPTARRIIEAHRGRITVSSEVGVGTQFTLEFPTPAVSAVMAAQNPERRARSKKHNIGSAPASRSSLAASPSPGRS